MSAAEPRQAAVREASIGGPFSATLLNLEIFVAPPAGLEPTAPGLGILCSIHLS
jgi:hypothetical protein